MPPDLDEVANSLILEPEAAVEEEVAEEVEEPTEEIPAEEGEEPAEGEEEAEDVDVDELDIEVQIDGETKAVKLKDLKAKYAGEGAIERRLQEATQARQAMYAYSSELYNNLGAQIERLNMLNDYLNTQTEPAINWEELRARDPGKYLLERDKFQQNEERKRNVAFQQQSLQAQQQQILNQAKHERAKEEAQILMHSLPALKDPAKAKQVLDDFVNVGREYGFTPEEIDNVIDHRAMMVLHDAIQWRKLQSKDTKPKVAQQQLRQLVRPSGKSTATTGMDKNKRLHEALVRKARSSGKPDDVAALLIVPRKK